MQIVYVCIPLEKLMIISRILINLKLVRIFLKNIRQTVYKWNIGTAVGIVFNMYLD